MTCFDCKKMHSKCQANCCSMISIPKDLYEDKKDKIVTQPDKVINSFDNHVLPITPNQSCIFLNEDFSCNIYEDRPSVCREFGNETHPMLYCPFLDKDGNERSRQNRRLIQQKSHKYISNYVKLQKMNYGK